MFSFIWKNNTPVDVQNFKSRYQISAYLPILWEEHCVECAMPLCYSSCKIYKPRIDGRCLRFEYGILPLFLNGSDLPCGQIKFRKWGKLEAVLPKNLNMVSLNRIGKIYKRVYRIGNIEKFLGNVKWSWHRPSRVLESLLEKDLVNNNYKSVSSPDGFLFTVFNHEDEERTLFFEIANEKGVSLKKSFILNPGWNEFFIPMLEITMDTTKKNLVRIFFENNGIGTLTIMNADFVSLAITEKRSEKPANKIKCIAWDLDNTLWEGVIGDAKDGEIKVKPDSLNLIQELDKRGIIQTVVSKNNFDTAWDKIKELKLDEYFIYPAINWGRKSQNLKAIAKEININIDTFGMIDDSEFERSEIKTALPQVRVYDISEINDLLGYDEFDIPITVESSKRRLSYLNDTKRKTILASWEGNYDSFLKDCKMEMKIFVPEEKADRERCLELLQRSNQYNINKIKRDETSFYQILDDSNYKCFAISVKDKFGDYGIVGFATIEKKEEIYYLRDFVMSCRVAQKKVERAFLNAVISELPEGKLFSVNIFKTDRNTPLRNEMFMMPFEKKDDKEDSLELIVHTRKNLMNDKIITALYKK